VGEKGGGVETLWSNSECGEAQCPLERRAQERARTFLEEVYPKQKRLEKKGEAYAQRWARNWDDGLAGRIGANPPGTHDAED
jgi:hypothetical protein